MSEQITSTLQTPDQVRETLAKSHGVSNTRAEGNVDLPGLFSLLYRMLQIDAPQLIFAPAYPKYLRPDTEEFKRTVDNPTEKFPVTITYRIVRREPATMGGNKEMFGTGFKELTPKERMRQGMRDGSQVVVYGQNFDNAIRFEIWCTSNFEAEKFVNWFEQYLRTRRVWLRNQGVGEILFAKRGEDQSELDNKLEYRSLIFNVRTEEISVEDETVLKNLEISLGIRA